ncbi:MAG: hypothetical protein LBJ00_13310 [Planctomycetaceae bacterium]|nr:hypothetical protein [Planctomycetaceae bacterium]
MKRLLKGEAYRPYRLRYNTKDTKRTKGTKIFKNPLSVFSVSSVVKKIPLSC